MASVTTYSNQTPRSVPINVKFDGDNMIWQSEPGAFLFLMQDAMAGS
ncbi:hypothetical protein [Mycolicibacterium mengxianglii]|nr:hypothetical protein [Mycolicibacterium mengxianglii]